MAYRALYRTWRPARFADVSGQAHIVKVLTGQIKAGRVAHAYLFSGPRGTGKTSLAKIFARAVNCASQQDAEPCGTCAACLETAAENPVDIVEIDAASNNGVDSVRDLRDRVNLLPASCRYKVYIIDEVHMLSKGAFNALLKTLEEPPAHVIFILATTEPHKLPPTILSRCQRFDFRRISAEDIAARLAMVAKAEGCDFEPEAIEMISRAAEGGMRDALSILDQCAASGAVTAQSVAAALGSGDMQQHHVLISHIVGYDEKNALLQLTALVSGGADTYALLKALADAFRRMMWISVGAADADADETLGAYAKSFGKQACIRALNILIQKEYEMRQNLRADIVLETAVLDIMNPEDDPAVPDTLRIEKLEARLGALEQAQSQAPKTAHTIQKESAAPKKPAEIAKAAAAAVKTQSPKGSDAGPLHKKLLDTLKQDAYHICPYASKAKPFLRTDGTLELEFCSTDEMSAEYLKQPAVMDIIKNALEKAAGNPMPVSVAVEQEIINTPNTDILAILGADVEEI